MSKEDSRYVIGVDVGGTNTDTAILCGNKVVGQAKCATNRDKTQGIVNSIRAALASLTDELNHDVLSSANVRVSIGTTHFTNAVIERDGMNLKRVSVIRLCGPSTKSLPPFIDIPEDLSCLIRGGVFLVGGGLEYNRKEISGIVEQEIRDCVRRSLALDPPVKNFVLCGVFSPCDNPLDNQEMRAAAVVRDECQQRNVECSCTLSHELGMLGLLERENAAILNESLKALARVTIQAFSKALLELQLGGSSGPSFFLTQNDGTLISAEEAMQYPVLTFSSGPTNSMRGAAFLSGRLNAIVVDIGGTTTDVGVLVNGFPRQASVRCEVGGVQTNFPMPDVHSIGLGGGSRVTFDPDNGNSEVGPSSVGYEITSQALCFGGQQCTATDVAIAAGVAPSDLCTTPQALSSLSPALVRASMDEMRDKLERIIDSMKTENEPWPVILVGGGSILVDKTVPLRGVSTVECPEKYWGVANAIGAALGTVGGSCDMIENLATIREQLVTANPHLQGEGAESLDTRAREEALDRGRKLAIEKAEQKGGLLDSIYIHSEELTDVTYVMDHVQVRVKAIGDLTQTDAKTATQPYAPVGAPPTEIKPETIETKETKYTPTVPSPVTDFASWPNSLEEERKKDEEAGLSPPDVDCNTGVWVLSEHDVTCLATGAGILGCGGGGSPYCGQLLALKLLREGKTIRIVNPYRVTEEQKGLVCGIAYMGAPAILIEKLPNGLETSLALDRLRRVLASGVCEGVGRGKVSSADVTVTEKEYPRFDGTHFPAWVAADESLRTIDLSNVPKERRVTALICLEAAGLNSIEPLILGAIQDLPVLDVDGMGRAFPELQMFVPFINGSRHTPSSLADNQGEVITCTHVETSKDLENFFRVETVRMGMSAAIASGVMEYSEMLEKSIMFTMSQAWQLGRAVTRARKLHIDVVSTICEQQHGMVLLTGKIISVHRSTVAGFTTIETLVEGLNEYTGCQLRVLAKNEYYIAQQVLSGKHKEVLACTPDLISIIDSNNGEAITTDVVRYGLRVGVVVLPANQRLKTSRALPVVGPKAFGFDIPYQEPRPFPRSAD